jgi:CoA:oxalate CoA-transferase
VGTSVGDITAGLFTTIGITSALHHRNQTGEGMKIDVSMLDCQIAFLENAISRYFASGEIPKPLGSRHPSITPFECYRTQDSYMVIAAGNDNLFAKLCQALGNASLAKDIRFLSNHDRTEHAEELKQEMEALLKFRTSAEWLSLLEQAGIPCGPINNVEQALNEPQIKARNMVVSAHDPETGEIHMAGNPIKLSAFPDPTTRAPAPNLNQHGEKILEEFIHTKKKAGAA